MNGNASYNKTHLNVKGQGGRAGNWNRDLYGKGILKGASWGIHADRGDTTRGSWGINTQTLVPVFPLISFCAPWVGSKQKPESKITVDATHIFGFLRYKAGHRKGGKWVQKGEERNSHPSLNIHSWVLSTWKVHVPAWGCMSLPGHQIIVWGTRWSHT